MAEHSIFGASPPPWTVNSYHDLGTDAWTSNFFVATGEPQDGWTWVGARLYLPEGSEHIGSSARASYAPQTPAGAGLLREEDAPGLNAYGVVLNLISNAEGPITLVAGWNEVRWATPMDVTWGDGFAVGWSIGDGGWGYVHVPGPDVNITAGGAGLALQALDGSPLVLQPAEGNGNSRRGAFGDSSGGSWAFQGAWYGADVILEDGGSPEVPVGSFGAAYALGPAVAEGRAEHAGQFEGTYGFGPAEAEGSAPSGGRFASTWGYGPATAAGSASSSGSFAGAYAFGPADAQGASSAKGEFGGAYSWGPAVFTGGAEASGRFAGAYRFGPARFSGSGESPCWPDTLSTQALGPRLALMDERYELELVPTAPALSLLAEGPTLILEDAECRP